MPLLPIVAAGLVLLAALSAAVGLVFGDSRLPEDSSLLLAIDLVILATVAAVGMVASKGRWAQRTATAVALTSAAVGVTLSSGWQATAAVGVVAAATTAGPWMRSWWLDGRRVDSPPGAAVLLVLSLLAMPGLIGAVSPDGLTLGRWLIAVTALGLGWAYSRAWMPALWAVRTVFLAVTALALIGDDVVTGLVILGGATLCTGLAWTRDALLAVTRHDPVRGTTYPIPPELAPEQIVSELPQRPPRAHRGKG